MYLSLTCRAIYDLYQNLYDTWFKGQSQETIQKVKAFFQTQVSNINTAVNFSNWLSLLIQLLYNLIPRPRPFFTLQFVFTILHRSERVEKTCI